MKCKNIIEKLKSICKFKYEINEVCTSISFYDESDPFDNTIRKNKSKIEIIKLVSKLEHLKHVNLRKTRIGNLPEFCSKDIEFLDLSCNDLEEVPNWILKQKNLNFLNLGANNIKKLPSLEHLPLKVLKLHKNSLEEFPKVSNSLKNLNLFLNKFKELPSCISNFSNLENFSFGMTEATNIPRLSNLQNLKWLTLAVNNFEYLPDDITYLSKLEGLQFAKNKLKKLPKNFGDMNIRFLTLYSNDLKELPESFFKLNLVKLNLEKNFLESFKTKILKTYKDIEFIAV